MDFSTVVSYEQEFPVKLLHPVTGEETGVVFNIVSFESAAVVKAMKKLEAERWQAVFANEDQKLTPEQFAEFNEKMAIEQVVSSVASWDWGGNEFAGLGEDAECTDANKRLVIEHPNSKWIRDQLIARGNDLGNFSQASVKNSARSSKRK